MSYSLLADLVLLAHLGFIAFVGGGGLLVARWPRLVWLHLPAAAWGAAVEIGNLPCPLTPLENHLRQVAGQAGYAGDFIGHYLVAVIYPEGLTRPVQISLGLLAVAMNLAIYGWLLRRRRHSSKNQ